MYITEIVIDGFKSYAKRVVISGFDREFNAITGLNGSGKSNILDSICFVLGISDLKQVRAANLNQLIYKEGQAGVTKASVTLVFNNEDPSVSPHGYEQLSQITITRQIAIGGRNKYMINGLQAQLNRVQNLFHSVQLNVNNPHFLIMQGRITKVLNMKPIEILGMIEEAAGTRMFETKKRKTLEMMEKKDHKLSEIKRVMESDIAPRIEKLSADRAQFLEFTRLQVDVESAGRVVQAYELVCAEKQVSECKEGMASDVKMRDELAASVKSCDAEDKELQAKLKETLAKKEKEAAGELRECQKAEQELSKQLVKINAEHTQLRKAYDADTAAAQANEDDIAKIVASQKAVQKDLDSAKANTQKAADAATEAVAAAAEKQSQYEGAIGLGASEGSKNLQARHSEAGAAVTARETEMKTADMRKKDAAKKAKEVEKQLTEARKSGGKQEKAHASLVSEVSKLRQKLQELQPDGAICEDDVNRELLKAQNDGGALTKKERELSAAVGGFDFKYKDPKPNWDRSKVKGTVAMNITIPNAQHNVALEALAKGGLRQVIVDNSDVGLDVVKKGGLTQNYTMIPLKEIQPRVLPADRVAAAKKLVGPTKANLAADLVDCDAKVRPAILHVFGNALVCADKEAARQVCDELKLKTVTLEGDLYDPAGTLTGGSRAPSGNSILLKLNELREVRARLSAHEETVAHLSAQLEKARTQGEKVGELQSALELKQHELQIATEAMRSSLVGELTASLESLQAQVSEAEAAAATAKADLATAKELQTSLAKEMKDFEGNRDERLAQAKKDKDACHKKARDMEKALQNVKQSEQKATLQLQELAKELVAAHEQRDELAKRAETSAEAIEIKASAEGKKRDEYDVAAAALKKCQKAVGGYDAECAEIGTKREALEKQKEDAQVELNKIEHRCARFDKDLAAAEGVCKELLKRHPWMASEREQFGVAGGPYDFGKKKVASLQKELAKKQSELESLSKRINKKVLTMLESAETEYSELKDKKGKVEEDKKTIEAVITELAQKKIETLQKTWEKVNGDFGDIFNTLLPSAFAKLEPQEGLPVEEGLIVKVGFGRSMEKAAWKQSLLELSGGQRSLIALSLVLSLLRFKPAPIYILDEVDAALDLSHTQNIGRMIKDFFTQSQFLVVSLKEGMFNNANVIFRTKFVDSVSCVTRTVPNAAEVNLAGGNKKESAPADKAAGKAPAAGGKRAALTAKN